MIKTKRWDEAREPDDGFRLLICRYRPRALPKKKETIALLAEKVAGGMTLTLLCSSACTDASHCHRTLLRGLIEERLPVAASTTV
jgi:uncharacterized protein YeaO (DUF488 family)